MPITDLVTDFVEGSNFLAVDSIVDHFITHIKLEGLSINWVRVLLPG